jgi:uncharacterized membrane protein YgcG
MGLIRALVLALLVAAGSIGAAVALDFPELTGKVVDAAGVIDGATRSNLSRRLVDLESRTGAQLVVVTLKSLQGTTIEDFGYQLGRRWGIGQKEKNNGVLLIVAPAEHKVRIEVGYGLEGTLTDAATRLIIENSILPRFTANDFSGGVSRGVDDLLRLLGGDAGGPQGVAGLPAVAATAEFPALGGRIVDDAGLLDAATRAALTEKLDKVRRMTGDQVVVATVKSIGGRDIEAFAVALADHWQAGGLGDNAVVMLVADDVGKVAIRVAKNLQPTLPDALIGAIIQNRIVPRLATGDMAGGLAGGVDAIYLTLIAADEDRRAREPVVAPPPRAWSGQDYGLAALFLALALGFIVMFIMDARPIVKNTRGLSRVANLVGLFFFELTRFSGSGSSRSSSSSSGGGGGSSGGGGSFGGGGSSGSW